MRYLDVSVSQAPAERNAMHQFCVGHEAYGAARLLHREPDPPDEHAALFHVEGPTEPYVDALEARSGLYDYAVSPCPDETFYCYVHEEMVTADRTFASAFEQPGLLVLTPVVYRPDGSVRVTAVGPADAVQEAVESVPDAMALDVRSVGRYDASRVDSRLEVTTRQFEAVQAAVDLGYYRAPREAGIADVAERLDCATGTAGELLRRAERTVMRSLVAGGPF
jgi:hypothetical protein